MKLIRVFKRVLSIIAIYFSAIPSAWVLLNPLLYIMFLPLGIHFAMTIPWPLLKDLPDPFGRETTLYFLTHVYSFSLSQREIWQGVSLVVTFSGVLVFLWSFLYWIKSRGKMMMSGPYRFIRHPQYFGLIIAVLGLCLGVARPIALISWGVMAYLYVLFALFEEISLMAKFDGYREYQKRTSFMLPLPSRLKKAIDHLGSRRIIFLATLILILYIMGIIYSSFYCVVSLR